jgi:hypothetical protein
VIAEVIKRSWTVAEGQLFAKYPHIPRDAADQRRRPDAPGALGPSAGRRLSRCPPNLVHPQVWASGNWAATLPLSTGPHASGFAFGFGLGGLCELARLGERPACQPGNCVRPTTRRNEGNSVCSAGVGKGRSTRNQPYLQCYFSNIGS